MLKQAFRSYISSLHPRNVKKLKSGGGFWIVYWLVIYPMLMSSINVENFAQIIWSTVIKMWPFLMMLWSNISSKFLMSKAMYLCPMTLEDRRKYINAVLVMKIGFPVLFGLLIEVVWSLFYGFHPLQCLAILFTHFSVGVATYICFEAPSKADRWISYARKDKQGDIRWAWMNVVVTIVGIFLLLGLEMSDLTEVIDLGSGIFIGICVVVMLILDICIIATQYEDTVESAGEYELNFRILGKVPTNENVEFDLFNKR